MPSKEIIRTRFAPSPTGHLHVGGARTAIFNWLFARHHGGLFVVRVEDTDTVRSTRESERMVLEDLQWLGLAWDEGPDVGGPNGPYRQSERRERYRAVAELLQSRGLAYRCFCDEETLEKKRRAAEAEGRPPHYDLTCHGIPEDEAARRVGNGEAHVIRFHVPKEKVPPFDPDVTIEDLIRGRVTWKKESLGDFVLLRSGGMPTYNFCAAIDDHDMQITHVIRAEEHLTNTQRQVLVNRALGWLPPAFAHVSLILGEDRAKLSKRHGATSVAAYAERGFLKQAMINYLTLLGWSPPDGNEVFSVERATESFTLDRVNKAAAIFDEKKLAWMNGQYIRSMAPTELFDLVAEDLEARGLLTARNAPSRSWFEDAIELVRKGVDSLVALVDEIASLKDFDPVAAIESADVREIFADQASIGVIAALRDMLRSEGAPRNADDFKELTSRIKDRTHQKGKGLFMPIRIAITGTTHGPELKELIPLLDRAARTDGVMEMKSPLERTEAVLAAIHR